MQPVDYIASGESNGLLVKLYLGGDMVLLAFDIAVSIFDSL